MDRYLSPQLLPPPHPADHQQKSQRDSASGVDQFFADDHLGAPYTLNMNLYLPEVAYLRMDMCQQPRPQHQTDLVQVKTESATACFSPNLQPHCSPRASSCSTSERALETAVNMLTGLPDFTSAFNQSGAGRRADSLPEVFVKQEMSSPFEQHALHHHDSSHSLFQLLNSGLDHHGAGGLEAPHHHPQIQHTPFHSLPVGSSASHQEQTVKPAFCGLAGGAYTHPHAQTHAHFLQQQVPYLPPSPPSSEPGSPDRQKELLHTMSPPPSYAATIACKLAGSTPTAARVPGLPLPSVPAPAPGQPTGLPQAPAAPPAPTPAPTTVPVRYNRRNNPDLEKRRIHHCDYPGETADGGLR